MKVTTNSLSAEACGSLLSRGRGWEAVEESIQKQKSKPEIPRNHFHIFAARAWHWGIPKKLTYCMSDTKNHDFDAQSIHTNRHGQWFEKSKKMCPSLTPKSKKERSEESFQLINTSNLSSIYSRSLQSFRIVVDDVSSFVSKNRNVSDGK